MGTIAGPLAIIGTVVRLGSTIIGGIAQARGGRAQRDAAFFEAEQMDMMAGEERAAGQREGFEVERQVGTLLSQGRVAASASGAGASDIGVSNVQADLARAGEVRAETANYTAGQRAQGLELQAEMRRRGGVSALQAGQLAAMGTIIGGFGEAAAGFSSWAHEYGDKAAVVEVQPTGFNVPSTATGRVGILERLFGGR